MAPKAGSEHVRKGSPDGPIVIKKYANRRLYNTATSSYVTLDHLCRMVKDDVDFVVYDARTGEDITRSVLTQIIVEEEAKGTNLLPITFLRQLISFYGDSMQAVVPRYLEQMMTAFATNQDRLRQQMQETITGMFPFGGRLEEVSRQNAALMESAMKMFTPFPARHREEQSGGTAPDEGERSEEAEHKPESLAELRHQVELLQQQLDELTRESESGGGDEAQEDHGAKARRGRRASGNARGSESPPSRRPGRPRARPAGGPSSSST